MSLVEQFNVGSRIRARVALANVSITQTSATLATTQDGVTVDRNAAGLRRYYSCKVIVAGALLGDTSSKTGSLTLNVQHSSDGTSWDNYSTGTIPTAVVFGATSSGYASGTTAGTEYNTVEQSVNLNGARRYIRVQVPAPTYPSCSSGVQLNVSGIIVFGGGDELPAQ